MRFLILSDMFSLESWLIDGDQPQIMPAVYEFFTYLGNAHDHYFEAIIYHPTENKIVPFPNGSFIEIKSLQIPFHYLRKFVSLFKMYRIGKEKIKAQSFDVVYGMTIYANVAATLGRKTNTLSVSRLFGSLLYDVIKKKKYFLLYTRFILQYFEAKYPSDIIICTEDGTEFDRALTKINPHKKAHLLYNGINKNMKEALLKIPSSHMIKDQKIRFISFGRLTQWKRHDLSIKVIHQLIHEFGIDQVSLSILGKGEEKSNLTQLIAQLKLEEHVHFLDSIPHEQIPDELQNHDIALFLYDASNLGNSLWEAALSGRVLCVRATGKTNEVFTDGKNALVCDSEDPKFIAEKIHEFLQSGYKILAENGRSTVEALLPSWKERIESEIDIISKGHE